MKYDYLIKKGSELVKFDSKKDIINWVKENEKDIKGSLELVRRVKKIDNIMVEDLINWVKVGKYSLVDEKSLELRKEKRMEIRNNKLNSLLG